MPAFTDRISAARSSAPTGSAPSTMGAADRAPQVEACHAAPTCAATTPEAPPPTGQVARR